MSKRYGEKCDRCSRPLWAPESIRRGYCEACRMIEIRRDEKPTGGAA